MALSCRFYKNKFPEVDDVVVAKVRSVTDTSAFVDLLEYNNIDGLILLNSHLSESIRDIRRRRAIQKQVGKNMCALVLRVDKEKGYIDMSIRRRRLSTDDISKCEEKFARAKAIHSILVRVCELLGYDDSVDESEGNKLLEELYEKTAWHFDEKYNEPGSSYKIFKQAAINPEALDECDIDQNTKSLLLQTLQKSFSPKPVKLRADFEVSCTKFEGIDAVKKALKDGLEISTESIPIKVNLIQHPWYVMTTTILEIHKECGLAVQFKALDRIQTLIEEAGGTYNLREQPHVMSDVEKDELSVSLHQPV